MSAFRFIHPRGYPRSLRRSRSKNQQVAFESLENRKLLAADVFEIDGSWTRGLSQPGNLSGSLSVDTDTGLVTDLNLLRTGGIEEGTGVITTVGGRPFLSGGTPLPDTTYDTGSITSQGMHGSSYHIETAVRGDYQMVAYWDVPNSDPASFAGGPVSFSFTTGAQFATSNPGSGTLSLQPPPPNNDPTFQISPYPQGTAPNGHPLEASPEGNWLFRSGSGSGGTSYYPTTLDEVSHLTSHGYVTYSNPEHGWFQESGNPGSFLRSYETYIRSNVDQTISYEHGGNDSSALFIDDVFAGGAGNMQTVSGSLELTANVPVKLLLVGYDAIPGHNVWMKPVAANSLESISGIELSAVPFSPAPTIEDVVLSENATEQTLYVAGISAGGGESQPLRVTATSNNVSLIPDPTITYTSPNATGTLKFTPVSDQSGTATITVTVEDGGHDTNLETAGDNATVSLVFDVIVELTNNPPSNVTLTDVVNTIPETDDTSSAIRIAGVDVTDDEHGSNVVNLSGPDASSFYYTAGFGGAFGGGFAQGGIYLNPGIALDAISKPSFQFTVEVSDTSLPGSDPATVDHTLTVLNVNDLPIGSVAIAGTPREDEVLTASNTLADADGLGAIGYQWKRDAVAISGATNSTYTLVQADVGAVITVTASYTDQGGTNESVTSAGTQVVTAGEDPSPPLEILNQGFDGGGSSYTLPVPPIDSDQGVQNTPERNFFRLIDQFGAPSWNAPQGRLQAAQILFNDTLDISSASSVELSFDFRITQVVRSADGILLAFVPKGDSFVGNLVHGQGQADSLRFMFDVYDNSVHASEPNANHVEINFDGNTENTDGWLASPMPTTQFDDGKWHAVDVHISPTPTGAKLNLYIQTDGNSETVVEDFLIPGFDFETEYYLAVHSGSGAEYAIHDIDNVVITKTNALSLNSTPTGSVTITGTPREDEVLTASNTLADADGLGAISYQWKRDAVAISGATNSTYTLVQADVGAVITVTGSYTDQGGAHESVTSAATEEVLNGNELTVASFEHGLEFENSKPTITGFGTSGASIEVFADLNRDGTTETSIGTTTVALDNSWSLTSDEWLPGGPVNVSATQNTGASEVSTADGVVTVRSIRPGNLVEFGSNLLEDGYINAAEAASNVVLRAPFDGSSVSDGASFWVFTDTGGNETFVLQTVGGTAQGNNYKDVSFPANILREGSQAIDAWFLFEDSTGKIHDLMYVTKDTIFPEATLGISETNILSNETATVSITLSEDVNDLDVTDFVVSGGTISGLSGASPNLTATFTPDPGFSGTATISIASGGFTDVAGNPNTESSIQAFVTTEGNSAPALDYLVLQANQAGSTVDIDDIVVRNLSTNAIEYSYDFNNGDLTNVQLLHTTDGTSAWEFDSSMTRIVNGKLRLESTGFNQNGSGGYNSRSRMAINRQLPPSFEIQFSVNKLQWAGHFFCGIVDASYDHSPVNDGNYQFLSRQAGGVAPVDNTPWVKVDGVLDQIRTGSTLSGLNGSDAAYRIVRQGTELSIYINSTRIGYASDLPDVSSSTNSTPTGSVTITGTAREDEVLTANNTLADADGLGVISWQWNRDSVVIDGATDSTYTLVQADVGAVMTVTASYIDGQGTAESVTSESTSAVVNVSHSPAGSVTILGTAREDEVLTANHTLTDQDGLGMISRQWNRDGVAIDGATNATYTLVQADVGASMTVTASYTDGEGTAESVTSAPTAVVENKSHSPTGSVTITGTAREDEVLTASHTLSDADGLGIMNWQWSRDGDAIDGANGTTYNLVQADVGAAMTVTANYTDGEGTSESVTSSTTTLVLNQNDAPVGEVLVSRFIKELVASSTLTDEDGLGEISWQWNRDGVAIEGATGSTYTLTQDDADVVITVTARYTDGEGTEERVVSSGVSGFTVISEYGTVILMKDASEKLYVNTQPVSYNGSHAHEYIEAFKAIGARLNGRSNELILEKSMPGNSEASRYRLVTDQSWRINGMFNLLHNESSPVLETPTSIDLSIEDGTANQTPRTLRLRSAVDAFTINNLSSPSPTIIIRRGQQCIFDFDLGPRSSIYLQTTGNGYRRNSVYSGNFSGNGHGDGWFVWRVPEDAPSELYYQDRFNPVKFGKIIVVD